ncbi:MAG: Adenylosuccinate synthetase [Microgenomates group bacterium ADurb.Bin219]|nr:MAG: Adenylosuccinate synthetase [Microgenomates group bacterium ADurb.Bin219]HNP89121.1 adenylosuccinate synthetase [Candidatus Woesebacteria bacterium]
MTEQESKRKNGAEIIVGAFWGDEGKGTTSAFLACRDQAAIVARAGVGPNAEHGLFPKENGPYLCVNQLPLGWALSPESQIRIGPGVCVNPRLLLAEIDRLKIDPLRVKVDFRCPIITPEHIEKERRSKGMRGIGSTFSGSGYCRADFILRTAQQARDIPELKEFLADVPAEINRVAEENTVIVESSQGTMLSLALSPDYPNTTSDNVTAMAAADDVGLNWQKLREVILVVKALPTREGGGGLGKVRELSAKEIQGRNLVERSSIQEGSLTGRIRRKAETIDFDLLAFAAEVNGATQIVLTFLDHFDPRVTNITERSGLTDEVWQLIEKVKETTGTPVTLVNTGKPFDAFVDLTDKKRPEGKIDQAKKYFGTLFPPEK